MIATIKWNARYSAREWMLMAGTLIVRLSALKVRQNGQSKRKAPLWKTFDDTHHWDPTAEDWVPNDDR